MSEIILSEDDLARIEADIEEDRQRMIAEARVNYPLKTFQGIDKDLRYATVMPNLGSDF